jgi:hypothetical protein
MDDLDTLAEKARAAHSNLFPWPSTGSVHRVMHGAHMSPNQCVYIAACSPDVILELIRRVKEAEAR